MSVIAERLKEIEGKRLKHGAGKNLDAACVMQMVSYVAGETWTDHPECACPVLTRMAINLNDRFSDADRQLLAPLIPVLVGTRGTLDDEVARAIFIAWRTVSVTMPIFLESIGVPEFAAELRATTRNREGMLKARDTLRARREEIREKARDAAAAYAYAAYAAYAADACAAYAADACAAAAAYAADACAAAAAYAYAACADAAADAIRVSAVETLRLACAVKAEPGTQ